jgi:hypothetical protein
MKLTKKQEKDILKIYDTWMHSYLNGDVDTYNYYLDKDYHFIGSTNNEEFLNRRSTTGFFKKTADQLSGKTEIRNDKKIMETFGNLVFITHLLDAWFKAGSKWSFYGRFRFTNILHETPKGWRFIYQHYSTPDNKAQEGETIGYDQISAENLQLRDAIKRRTKELEVKNKELEIESSLEKVRSVAMAMRRPADMLDVCKTISLQLNSLGVKDIRNVQTAIIYASKSIYINYEYYAKHKKQLITVVDFKSHYYQKLFVNKMLKGTGEIFTKTLKGKKVKEWYEYQKTTNQFADRYLIKAKSLSYYWFSLGPLALGISTYSPLSEEQLNLFIRFRNVFELAYQRYLDIEKAEGQAREAKIEASLEKVRAVAMSMHNSEDLLNVCEMLYKEFCSLGFDGLRNAMINIHNDEKKSFVNYDYSDEIGRSINQLVYDIHPLVEKQIKKIRSADDAFSETYFTGKDLVNWRKFRKRIGEKDDPRLHQTKGLFYYFYSIGIGSIGISTFGAIDEDLKALLKRFRNVFALSYQRYMDISKAEVQAREAQIETALEKVRSRSLGMHKSNELQDIVNAVFERLNDLKIDMNVASIFIFKDDSKDWEQWVASSTTNYSTYFHIPYMDLPVFRDLEEAKQKRKDFYSVRYSLEQKNQWFSYAFENTEYKQVPVDRKKYILESEFFLISFALSKHSGIQLAKYVGKDFTQEENEILKRFARVFEQAYIRFLDLQKAEAQAREAQIEVALEKVRSRTIGMQRSDELQDAAVLLFQQVVALGVPAFGSGFNIWDDDRKFATAWMAGQDRMQPPFKTSSSEDIFLRIYEAAERGESLFVEEQGGEALKIHYEYMKSIPIFKEIADKMATVSQSFPTFQVMHCAFFSSGYLMFISLEPVPDAYDIFKRFAKVFEQTYTRFLDLQKAEAQAREAQIEAALEKVRSRTMGMQKSDELKEVIKIVYQQLIQLKINLDHAGFVVDYTPGGDWHFWIADEQDIPSKITHPYFDSIWANQFNEAKEKGEDLFVTNLNFEQKNKFYQELLSHIPGLPETSKEFYLNCPGLAATTVVLDNIGLYIENFSGIPYSDEENKILIRFGKVFQQTYTRFLDLQRAESQNKIIQAENERKSKELEDARQLQLSMLPKVLPKLPHLDIAVHMKTATEVGGDYYDYNVDEDGTLTFVIGDATGHGMMSGMMVSIMKSFFISSKSNIELKSFFEDANNSIKDMQLGRLMMACMGVQITSEKIIATNAGMPSLIYFRNKSQKAGEFVSHNFPLGGMKGTIYSLKEIKYERGDTLLLMSDGFAELKNENNEQYGYPRIIEEFKSVVQKTSNEILEHLKNSAAEWAKGTDPDDDITFVVIKIR